MVRIGADLTFEPQKVNIFNKDCRRGAKDVSCMSVTVCLMLEATTAWETETRAHVCTSQRLTHH